MRNFQDTFETPERSFISVLFNLHICTFKGALSGLRQFLAAKSPLKMMKNAFYFTPKALSVLKTFNFCRDLLVM